ncbi:MAG: hypothetical protein ABR599_09995 [Gemmatimonadota bacterium]
MVFRSLTLAGLSAAMVVAPLRLPAQEGERLIIEHADQVQRLAQGDSVSYYLDGNVRGRRGDLRLTAEHAVVLEWLGLLDLSRNVHVWDAEQELFADHVTYTDSTDVAVATGNVQVVDRASGSQLRSQQVVYDRAAGLLTATQDPEMILLPDPADPDSAGASTDSVPEPIHVWSEQVQLFTDGEDLLATGDVLIRRGETLTAKADSVRRVPEGGVLALRGTPRVESDRFYVEAAQIDVLLPGDELEALVARGQARATSVADSIPPRAVEALGNASPGSWLAGDTLRFTFEDEVLRTLRASGSARSLSYGLESSAGDATTWALNYLLAGRIDLFFDAAGESLRRVEATRDGQGVYRTAALAGAEGRPVESAGAPADTAGQDGGEADPDDGAGGVRAPDSSAAPADTSALPGPPAPPGEVP